MRDIFDLIDEIEVDDYEMEEMNVSEFEKEKIKRDVKKAMKKKKHKKNGLAAAAVCCALIGSIGTLGIVNPTYAADIPIVGDIFRFLDNGRTGVFDKYKENSDGINITKEDKGISITIRDAVFYRNTIAYTYEIRSDIDLGTNPSIRGVEVKGHEDDSYGEGSSATRAGDNVYVGQGVATYDDEINEDNIKVKINIDSIPIITENSSTQHFKGNWEFNFNLHKVQSTNQIINKDNKQDGIKCSINNIYKTPMSFSIEYSICFDNDILNKMIDENASVKEKTRQQARAMCGIRTMLEVKDDLGNVYINDLRRGYSPSDDMSNIDTSCTFGQLNPEATKLIITPKIKFRDDNELTFEKEDDDIFFNGDDLKGKEIIFDDIVVDLDK